ncbi:general odorant-binding protein 99b precursor [Stomoxys calcitrans]|uniref:Putative odorant binding protein n=1 Tax=Stomoxys calcitrans TaxID=35570 RepID=D7R4H4_STOCA|nr:general odorant-binding protein 99b precursor [Stomoxys calcitrans]ADG96057.1 putative odorant binding protein [Stomoxys calcitrans]
MKVFIVVLCLASAALAHHEEGHAGHDHHDHHDHHISHDGHDYTIKTKEDLSRFREDCATKLKVSSELLEKYKNWDYPNEETTRCYLKCVFEHFGFFDETKGFNPYMIHHQLAGAHGPVDHNDELHRSIDFCADHNSQKSDACTWAYRGGMCFIGQHLQLIKDSLHQH